MYEGWGSVILGLALICVSCYYLFHVFPKIAKGQDITISIVALRVSSWLVIGGFIIILLGLLYLMRIIPWWS